MYTPDKTLLTAAAGTFATAFGSWLTFRATRTHERDGEQRTERERIDKKSQEAYADRLEEIVELKREREELKSLLTEAQRQVRETQMLLDRQIIITERQEIQIDILISQADEKTREDILRFRNLRPRNRKPS